MAYTRRKKGGGNRPRSHNRRQRSNNRRRNNSEDGIKSQIINIVKNVKNKDDLKPLVRLLGRIRDNDTINVRFDPNNEDISDAIRNSSADSEVKIKIRRLLSRHPLDDNAMERIINRSQSSSVIANFNRLMRRPGVGMATGGSRVYAPSPHEELENAISSCNRNVINGTVQPGNASGMFRENLMSIINNSNKTRSVKEAEIHELAGTYCDSHHRDIIIDNIDHLLRQSGGKRTKRNRKSKRRNMRSRRR